VAATSRLGYALGRDGALPSPLAHLSARGVPDVAIGIVATIAIGGLLLGWILGWGAEVFLAVPNSLVIIVYIVAMAAGARLLTGLPRLIAVTAALPCLAILPFAGVSLIIPAGVATGALLFTVWHRNERPAEAFGCDEQG